MRRKPRKKKDDLIAGILLFFLVIFLSGRIFSAGWDEFYATTQFISDSTSDSAAPAASPSDGPVSQTAQAAPPTQGDKPASRTGQTASQTKADPTARTGQADSQGIQTTPPTDPADSQAGQPASQTNQPAHAPVFVPGGSMVADPEEPHGQDGILDVRCLVYLQRAYPDVNFARSWDPEQEDWLITMTIPADGKGPKVRTADFLWAGGALLPREELEDADNYRPILYEYPRELADPADMTEEEREAIRQFSSAENRRNGAGSSMFFFDFLYQSDTRGHLEAHITNITFLRHRANVHERMVAPLRRVEKRVFALVATDKEVATFLSGLKSNDSYLWRVIAGTKRKSFHSLGIALDVLPKSQGGKHIFWSWAKERHPDDWMLIPLKNRWMPPKSVVEAFEEEGFIWGGKWAIWDNMHFEYHPELLEFNYRR